MIFSAPRNTTLESLDPGMRETLRRSISCQDSARNEVFDETNVFRSVGDDVIGIQ